MWQIAGRVLMNLNLCALRGSIKLVTQPCVSLDKREIKRRALCTPYLAFLVRLSKSKYSWSFY